MQRLDSAKGHSPIAAAFHYALAPAVSLVLFARFQDSEVGAGFDTRFRILRLEPGLTPESVLESDVASASESVLESDVASASD